MLHNVAYICQMSCFSYMLSLFIYLFVCLEGFCGIFFLFFNFPQFFFENTICCLIKCKCRATPLSKEISFCIPCKNILMYFMYNELHLFRFYIRCYKLSGIIKGKFCFLWCPFLLCCTRCFLLQVRKCFLHQNIGMELNMESGEKNGKNNIPDILTLFCGLFFFSCQSAVDDSETSQSCNFLRVHWQR